MPELPQLSDRDRAILELEFQEIAHGAKEERIRTLFGISPARYYQLVNRLLEHPAAIAEWPVEVGRLRRLRESRTRRRLSRSFSD